VLAATGAAEAGGQVGVVALGAAGGSLGGMPVEDEKMAMLPVTMRRMI